MLVCSEEKCHARQHIAKKRTTWHSEIGIIMNHETNSSCDHDELVLQECMDVASKGE